MKLKILLKGIEKILGMADNGNGPRADMYLPDYLLAMALIFLAGGIACTFFAIFRFAIWAVVCAVFGIGLGVAALLC